MDFRYRYRYRLWVATMVVNLDMKHFEKTPPHFCEVFAKPHPVGSRRFAPTMSRLRLGLEILINMNTNCKPTMRGKYDV
ncbi:MAG: hypothetical protein ACI88H_002123 [Cocleimonas sp.]|jgi:hypothetical protein